MKTGHVLKEKYSTEKMKLFKIALCFTLISSPIPFLSIVILYITFSLQVRISSEIGEEPDVQVG